MATWMSSSTLSYSLPCMKSLLLFLKPFSRRTPITDPAELGRNGPVFWWPRKKGFELISLGSGGCTDHLWTRDWTWEKFCFFDETLGLSLPFWFEAEGRPPGVVPFSLTVQSYSRGCTGPNFFELVASNSSWGMANALTGWREGRVRASTPFCCCLARAWSFLRWCKFSRWKFVLDIGPGFESQAGSVIRPIVEIMLPQQTISPSSYKKRRSAILL